MLSSPIFCPSCGREESPYKADRAIDCPCGEKYLAKISYAYYSLYPIFLAHGQEPAKTGRYVVTPVDAAAAAPAPVQTETVTVNLNKPGDMPAPVIPAAQEPARGLLDYNAKAAESQPIPQHRGRQRQSRATLTPEQIAAVDDKIKQLGKNRTWLRKELGDDCIVLSALNGEAATIYKINKILLWAGFPLLTEAENEEPKAKTITEAQIKAIGDPDWRNITLQELYVGNTGLALKMFNARNWADALQIRNEYHKRTF